MKIKLVLLSVVLLLPSSVAASAPKGSALFPCNGEILISDEDFIQTPSWNPEKDDNPPLSARKAVGSARIILSQCRPNANDNWRLSKIELHPMGTYKWVYIIEFDCPSARCVNERSRYFEVFIKLDGTVILPKQDDQPTEKLDTSDNPIPSDGIR